MSFAADFTDSPEIGPSIAQSWASFVRTLVQNYLWFLFLRASLISVSAVSLLSPTGPRSACSVVISLHHSSEMSCFAFILSHVAVVWLWLWSGLTVSVFLICLKRAGGHSFDAGLVSCFGSCLGPVSRNLSPAKYVWCFRT